jgi:hypothetical protein
MTADPAPAVLSVHPLVSLKLPLAISSAVLGLVDSA